MPKEEPETEMNAAPLVGMFPLVTDDTARTGNEMDFESDE